MLESAPEPSQETAEPTAAAGPSLSQRLAALEELVAQLRTELDTLKAAR
jgi:hypothetical protein